MNNKDIFDLINNGFTVRNTSDSYNRLCNFVAAMRCGQYYPISDEDIHRGVECEKAQTKAKTKILFMNFPEDMKKSMDAAIELKYAQCLQTFLDYKRKHENHNYRLIF